MKNDNATSGEASPEKQAQQGALGVASGSASQVRHRQMEVEMAFDLMSRMSELQQAERIARHYLSHAASAQHLLKITELVRYGGELTDDTKAAIKYLADQIRNNHAHDLGIELSWPNKPDEERPAGRDS